MTSVDPDDIRTRLGIAIRYALELDDLMNQCKHEGQPEFIQMSRDAFAIVTAIQEAGDQIAHAIRGQSKES
jgi:hypothetical protein